ncbi:YbaB/EbfC family nucleoid-associated protein [Fodinicola feengrottensis]|uniref:YbaB/EbfC family DNA-binding protein n=1 Tax=Fodinicola feengrottensis TaxID=435914 RepID=A0ABP4U6S5_9ACTN|nr:YbaB/EbfC family nucleoid-associated protein [Fodinicola feengrottensis]
MTGFDGVSHAEAEQILADADKRLEKVGEFQERTKELVGKAESKDGRVTVEYGATDGLTTLKIDPRAMQMQSQELSEAIVATIRAATSDLRDKTTALAKDMLPKREEKFDRAAVRQRLEESLAQLTRTANRAPGRKQSPGPSA